MAQQQHLVEERETISLLKIDNQGWDIELFEEKDKISNDYLCEYCKCVCCDASELGCNHNDNQICLYCKNCLSYLINKNDGKCIINKHSNPIISPTRSTRRKIGNATINCPYSMKYKHQNLNSKNNKNNNEIIDTIGMDEKEGVMPQQNNNIIGCEWIGSLNDLINTNHLKNCIKIYNPSFNYNINLKKLQKQINLLKNDNKNKEMQIQNLINKNKQNNELKQQINLLKNENKNMKQQLQNKENQIQKLKNENKKQLVLIQDLIKQNENKNEEKNIEEIKENKSNEIQNQNTWKKNENI